MTTTVSAPMSRLGMSSFPWLMWSSSLAISLRGCGISRYGARDPVALDHFGYLTCLELTWSVAPRVGIAAR